MVGIAIAHKNHVFAAAAAVVAVVVVARHVSTFEALAWLFPLAEPLFPRHSSPCSAGPIVPYGEHKE